MGDETVVLVLSFGGFFMLPCYMTLIACSGNVLIPVNYIHTLKFMRITYMEEGITCRDQVYTRLEVEIQAAWFGNNK